MGYLKSPLEDQGLTVIFPKYLSDPLSFLDKILANPKQRIDKLKNILKFVKNGQISAVEGLKIR